LASSRTLLGAHNGAKLWLVDLGGGLNQTYFVDCPRFERSLAFANQADAAAYLEAYDGPVLPDPAADVDDRDPTGH
jgi:hypothetical protein